DVPGRSSCQYGRSPAFHRACDRLRLAHFTGIEEEQRAGAIMVDRNTKPIDHVEFTILQQDLEAAFSRNGSCDLTVSCEMDDAPRGIADDGDKFRPSARHSPGGEEVLNSLDLTPLRRKR